MDHFLYSCGCDTKIEAALNFAMDIHGGRVLQPTQLDKGRVPIIHHVLDVARCVELNEDATVVAMLHDTVEDAPNRAATALKIRSLFGSEVADRVLLLARSSGESYDDYITRILASGDPIVLQVKIADIYDNLRIDRLLLASKYGADVARLVAKYTRALRRLVPSQSRTHCAK